MNLSAGEVVIENGWMDGSSILLLLQTLFPISRFLGTVHRQLLHKVERAPVLGVEFPLADVYQAKIA